MFCSCCEADIQVQKDTGCYKHKNGGTYRPVLDNL